MIGIFSDLEYIRNRELKAKVNNKLRQFLWYIMDMISELEKINEEWLYEDIFTKTLYKEKKELCKKAIETLSDWVDDEYIHTLKPIHEYALFGIIQYCKEVDKEFLESEGRSLFGMNHNLKYDTEEECIEDLEGKIDTFEFYENDFFRDYDFLNMATYYEIYKNNSLLLNRFGINLDDYAQVMPLDIEEEYIENKDRYVLEDINFITADNGRGEDNMNINPKVFISYSWDSEEHKEWVKQLWKTLRDNGVDSSIDEIETQNGTINLNHMMVDNIKNSDYIIVVLTEEYANRADELRGGVGRETNFLYNYLIDNTKKIIPIVKSGGEHAIPFYIKGLHYIDFSNERNINKSLEELLYRVFNKCKIEVPNLGAIPELKTQQVQGFNLSSDECRINTVDEDLVPDLSSTLEPTDMDKNRFIKNSYNEIKDKLSTILELTKQKNNIFDYDFEQVTNLKSIIRVYLNGESKYSMKIWVSNSFSRELSINISYGYFVNESDSSMNEIINCSIDKNNNLFLKMTLNYMNRNEYMTVDDVFKVTWKQIIDNIR